MANELLPRKPDDFLKDFPTVPAREPGEVRGQVERICNSEAFVRSLRIKRLLEFLVESVLAGQQDRLKEAVIGIEVFDRSAGYDSKIDPIVRVEMRRIRSKLSEYYLSEGRSDNVLIWLDKGSYVPVLLKRLTELTAVDSSTSILEASPPAPGTVLLPSNEPASIPPPSLQTTNPFRYGWIVAALLAATIMGTGFWVFSTRSSKTSRSLRLFPLTGNAGVETSPAFSPDGKQVAYTWDGNRQNLDIYVKPVEGGVPRRLTDNAAHDIHPAWSPDGRRIAFLRVSSERTQLLVIPSTSGVETVISEITPSVIRWHAGDPAAVGANGPIWSPDGSYVVIARNAGAVSVAEIEKLYLDGRREALTTPLLGATDSNPSISSSGNIVAFVRTWGPNSRDLFTTPSGGGRASRITFDSRDIQGLAWLDQDRLIYSSDREGNFRLWQVSSRGGEPQPVFAGGARPQWPAISRDGHWLAFVESVNDANIWQLPLDRGSPSGQGQPFISSAGTDNSPAYSPDGKRIAFVSDRSGKRQIWLSDSDGTQIRQLTNFAGSAVGSPRWSPDSRRLVFDASFEAQSAIWLIDDDGNNLRRLNNSTVREYLPSWSRDGQWVYFASLRNGRDQLWKQRPDSGQVVHLTQDLFFDAVESPAENIVYVQSRQGGIWQMPLQGGTPVPVPELGGVNPVRYWTLAGQKLYFVRQEQSPRELESFDLQTRQIRKLSNIPGELLSGTPGLAVDPSLHSLLFVQKNQPRSSIMLQER